jgi:Dolichyl-phosphate-mannose-protein mannosyltransferase
MTAANGEPAGLTDAHAQRVLASPLAIVAAVVALRAAGFFFGVLSIDESDFCLIGGSLAHGGIPFVDAVDIKPPLLYVLYAPASVFGPPSILVAHVLGIACVVATVFAVRAAARIAFDSEEAGWAAAWLAVLANLCEVPSVNAEVAMNLPVAVAFLWFAAAEREDRSLLHFASGCAIGVASLCKQQAALFVGTLGLSLLVEAFRAKSMRPVARALWLSVGFAAPWAATLAVYAAIGHLPELIDWVFTRNFVYAHAATPMVTFAGRFAHSFAVCVGSTIFVWWCGVRETVRPRATSLRSALLLSTWLTWMAVALGGRFYEHYFLQFVVPLSLLGAPAAADLARRWSGLGVRARSLAAFVCCASAAGYLAFTFGRGLRGEYPSQEPRALAAARWVRDHTRTSDSVFVWGHYSPIYLLAERAPGTRYLTTSVHVGNFDPRQLPPGFDAARFRSERDIQLTIDDLQNHRVPWIVDTAPADIHSWGAMPLSKVPELQSYVAAHYDAVAIAGGATMYRRREATTAGDYQR